MLFKAKQLMRVDACRDGGSLVASFLDEADVQYALTFPIELGPAQDGRLNRLGYRLPKLAKYVLSV